MLNQFDEICLYFEYATDNKSLTFSLNFTGLWNTGNISKGVGFIVTKLPQRLVTMSLGLEKINIWLFLFYKKKCETNERSQ